MTDQEIEREERRLTAEINESMAQLIPANIKKISELRERALYSNGCPILGSWEYPIGMPTKGPQRDDL